MGRFAGLQRRRLRPETGGIYRTNLFRNEMDEKAFERIILKVATQRMKKKLPEDEGCTLIQIAEKVWRDVRAVFNPNEPNYGFIDS